MSIVGGEIADIFPEILLLMRAGIFLRSLACLEHPTKHVLTNVGRFLSREPSVSPSGECDNVRLFVLLQVHRLRYDEN